MQFDLLLRVAGNRLVGGRFCPDALTAILCMGGAMSARNQKFLALASTRSQIDLIGAQRQMHRFFCLLGSKSCKDALVTTQEDADWGNLQRPALTLPH